MRGTGRRDGLGTRTRRWAGAWRTAGVVVALMLVVIAGCDREVAPAYDGDPEGRVVTAGTTADDLVTHGETARRIAEVELSAGLVERWFTAQERLDELAMVDPGVRRMLDARGGDGSGRGDAIEGAVRHLEREARVRDAIEASGLSTREFVMTALALHQALIASGPGAPRALRSLAARNVRFVDRHGELLEQLAMPRPPRALVYVDTFGYDDPDVDTLSPDDEVPYDPSYDSDDPVPDPFDFDTVAPVPYDTGLATEPVLAPTIDTVNPPPPPIVVPPVPPAGSVQAAPRPVPAPQAPAVPPAMPLASPPATPTAPPPPG